MEGADAGAGMNTGTAIVWVGWLVVGWPASRRRMAAASESASPAGSPTNSRNASQTPPAVVRS